jgi:hypothetical protein
MLLGPLALALRSHTTLSDPRNARPGCGAVAHHIPIIAAAFSLNSEPRRM